MRKQTVMWTALPAGVIRGIESTSLRLSVFVTPKLETNEGLPRPSLSQFPDFVDWPAAAPGFTVAFEGGPALPAAVTSQPPDSQSWKALFSPSTYVRPYQFQRLDDRFIRSFPAGHVLKFIKQQYQEIGLRQPTEHPIVESLATRKSWGLIGGLGEKADMKAELDKVLQQQGAVPPSPTPSPRTDFFQARLFHQPRSQNRAAIAVPDLDFHQAVSSLGEYPVMLRMIGLVFDLEIRLGAGIPTTGRVQVIPAWTPELGGTVNQSPYTAFALGDGSFQAAPRPVDPEIRDGLLRLDDGSHQVIQVDVDGAAMQAMNFADHLLRMASTQRSGYKAALPAMRSGGLMLVKTGRAYRLARRLDALPVLHDDVTAGSPVTLYAEDLTRGYRVDIWDSRSEVWHSLCRRVGKYAVEGSEFTAEATDEGFVSMGITSAADGSSPDLYLHESLLRWNGWSLAAPRPGRIITPDDGVDSPEENATTDFKLKTSFKPEPGTLPRLRYGLSYRIRARAADLAGNSLQPDLDSPDGSTGPERYTRFDPITSPTLVLKAPATTGESVEHLVIRSNYDVPSTQDCQRHVAPPKAAQLLAEEHGLFDTGSGLEKSAHATITSRDGFLPETEVADSLALPYLPDPAARGAAFLNLPGGDPTEPTQVAFDGSWPGAQPFRLRTLEGTGAPAWDGTQRVLTVYLPKATIARVRISAYLSADDLKLMGIWSWLEESGAGDAALNKLRQAALQGRHWMITPFREITLVHAVQQPLIEPAYQSLSSDRAVGQTFTTLKDDVLLDAHSTARLDVTAEWQEPVDALSEPKWKLAAGKANPCHFDVDYTDTTGALNHRHEFGDTKYRRVRYAAVATTRYEEYFRIAESESRTLTGSVPVNLAYALLVSQSEKVTSGDGSVAYARDLDYTIDYPAGRIIRIAGGGIGDGQQVKIEYARYPGPITRHTVVPTEVDVLSSARPAAPKPLYVLPTFGWERKEFDDGLVIKRSGGGLRVYMERPWFSSGDGEMLGVVLWPGPGPLIRLVKGSSPRPPENLRPYMTQWGMDPAWLTSPTRPQPALAHFPRAVAKATGLTLEEAPEAQVHVAGHAVGYDETRQLWYCDLEIDAGISYYPFVRLALARYQPHSIPNTHLSRVVLADFAQLAPDRLATITTDSARPKLLALSICGPGYLASGAGPHPSEMEVSVERRRSDVEGELGWVPVTGATFALTATDTRLPELTWTGQVTLPEARGTRPYRLVIKEYERFQSDGEAPFIPSMVGGVGRTTRRLVYACVFEV